MSLINKLLNKDVKQIIYFYVWLSSIKLVNSEMRSVTHQLNYYNDRHYAYKYRTCYSCNYPQCYCIGNMCRACIAIYPVANTTKQYTYTIGWCHNCEEYTYMNIDKPNECIDYYEKDYHWNGDMSLSDVEWICDGCDDDMCNCEWVDPLKTKDKYLKYENEYYLDKNEM